ncbi:Cytochrome c4 [Crenothrix polyspora]|uniref:Cytochrome c4 n=1 Tax=Crenothrix polyspora TaxID=360316 RepID=A0A1R4GYJ3_9GAMM|nr:c-type cytochrome [Crenothrix polyspora]SJM89001.1 Cytochrome c4 [Crenothrix polyspora]
MMTRMLVLMAALVAPILGHAVESGSQIAWTTETLKLVKKGNVEKGKSLAESCKSCHGEFGQGMSSEVVDDETIPAIPALAGQVANYTFKQLRDYFNGDRSNDSMTSIAKGLTEQDAADLAAWYAWLPAPKQKVGNNEKLAIAEKMVREGDGKRILPPCFVCHGANGQGEKMDIPSLAGQHADYFERTLLAYKNDQRHNDIYSRMRLIAKQLKDDEIKALARYYQNMQ